MKNLKEKFYNLFKILKNAIEKFPLTIIGVLLLTIINTICFDNEFLSSKTLGNITLFITIFSSSTFLIETLIKEDMKKRIPYYILSGLIGAIFTFAINTENDILGMTNEIFLFRIVRLLICYVISMIILGIFFNYKKSGKTFGEYITHTFINIFKSSLIYGIIAIGIAIVTAIFIYLILDGKGYSLVVRMEILLLGMYYIPTLIYSFYHSEDEIGKFAKIVIKYVLGTLVMAAFAIIYIYILKILILRNMPSNQIFRILSALFIIGLPIWTMIQSFQEETAFDKINKKLPLLFIPFIILQIYSIGIRIKANGITEPRYLCIMLILFEIIYTIIYLKNKEKIGNILITFMIFTAISTIVPYANMFYISNLSQAQKLKIYKEKSEYTEEEKNKICGAYYYLKHSVEGEKFIDKYLTKEDKTAINELNNDIKDSKYKSRKRIDVRNSLEYLNVEEYKKVYPISSYEYLESKEIQPIDEIFQNMELEVQGNENIKFKENILPLIKQYIEHEKNIDEYFEKNNELILNKNRKIILDNFSIQYNKETNEVIYYNISGYLLEK